MTPLFEARFDVALRLVAFAFVGGSLVASQYTSTTHRQWHCRLCALYTPPGLRLCQCQRPWSAVARTGGHPRRYHAVRVSAFSA